MYYYKARIYSPTLGRFMQTDPIGYEDQVNLYAYVGNDPVNSSDPSGEQSCRREPCPNVHLPSERITTAGRKELGPSSRAARSERGVQVFVDVKTGALTFKKGREAGRGTYNEFAFCKAEGRKFTADAFGSFSFWLGPEWNSGSARNAPK